MTEKISEMTETSNVELTPQQQYKNILEKALQAAILLNKIIRGKSVEEYSDEELSEAIFTQSNVVTKEEIIEWISNYGLDTVEELDGQVDVIYTLSYLHYLIEEAKRREFVEINYKHTNLILMLGNVVLSNLSTDDDGYYDTLEEAVDRIIENNMSKVTTDVEYFKTWESPKGENLIPKSTVVDGTRYYLLVNAEGKCRKPDHFVSVNLTDLAERLEKQWNGVANGKEEN